MFKMMRKICLAVFLVLVLFFTGFALGFHFATSPKTAVPDEILEDPETKFYHVSIAVGPVWYYCPRGVSCKEEPRDYEPFYLGRIVVNFKRKYLEFDVVTPAPGEWHMHFVESLVNIQNQIRQLKNILPRYISPPPPVFFPDPEVAPLIAVSGSLRPDIGEKYFKNGWVREREYEKLYDAPDPEMVKKAEALRRRGYCLNMIKFIKTLKVSEAFSKKDMDDAWKGFHHDCPGMFEEEKVSPVAE